MKKRQWQSLHRCSFRHRHCNKHRQTAIACPLDCDLHRQRSKRTLLPQAAELSGRLLVELQSNDENASLS
jgi:hypothetical protein